MDPIMSPYVLIMVAAAMICVFIAVYVWPRRRINSETIPLVFLLLDITEWIIAALLGLLDQNLAHKILWAKIEYIGVVSVPLAVLVYVLHHSGGKQLLTVKRLAWLALIPATTLILAWTNSYHGFIWAKYVPYQESGLVFSEKTYGPGFWAYWIYSYLILLAATVVAIRSMLASAKIFRWQSILVVIGILAPWAGNLLYVLHIYPFQPKNLDLTPLAFSITSIMLAIGMFRWHLFDIKPIAQAAAIAGMTDGLLILDNQGRIVDANPATQALLGLGKQEMVGKRIEQIIPSQMPSSEESLSTEEKIVEIRLRLGQENRDYELSASTFYEAQGFAGGRIVFLHDVTNEKRLEERLHEAERKNAEALLLQAENKYKTLYQNMSVGAIYQSSDGKVTDMNPAAEHILGVSPAQISDLDSIRANLKTVYEDGSDFPAEEYPSMISMKTGKPVQDQLMGIYFPDEGAYHWINVNTIPQFRTGEDKPYQVFVTFDDITERKRADTALRESEEKFRLLTEKSVVGIYIIQDAKMAYVNPSLSKMFGYEPEEMIGRLSLKDLIHPDDIQVVIKRLQERLDGESESGSVIYKAIKKDGSIIYIEVYGMMIDFQGRPAVMGTLMDVTERKQAEDALRESQERFSKVFHNSSSGINIFRLSDNRSIDANDSYLELIGYSREEVIGHSAAELNLFVDADARNTWLKKLRENRTVQNQDIEFRHKSGETRHALASFSMIDIQREPTGLVITNDITKRKQAEERIERQIKYLTALQEIDRSIAATFDMRLSLNILLSRAISLLAVDATSVLLVNSELNRLEFAAGLGFQTRAMEAVKLHLNEGLAGRAAMERRLVQIPNLAKEPDNPLLVPLLKEEMFVSYYGAPLIVKGKVVGVLEVFHRSAAKRDLEWLDFFNTLAGQAAIAVDNAQMFDGLQRSNMNLSMAYDATIVGWSRAMDLRDKETEVHTQRVTELTEKLAARMGFRPQELVHIRRGALLHDIGKLGVPDSILLKPYKLTDEEWEIMKRHPAHARDMLSSITYLEPALNIPYCHHERWDGTGYPQGLKGEQIPLAARLFSIVDVWDAVTSDRPYRAAWSQEEALTYIREQSGKQFDPEIVGIFLNMMAESQAVNH